MQFWSLGSCDVFGIYSPYSFNNLHFIQSSHRPFLRFEFQGQVFQFMHGANIWAVNSSEGIHKNVGTYIVGILDAKGFTSNPT